MDFKVKCINDKGGNHTVDKVYEVVNGIMRGDYHTFSTNFKNVKEINDFFKSQFELYQEPKFTKADLQSGDWCVCRGGYVGQVIISGKIKAIVDNTKYKQTVLLDQYKDDLTCVINSFNFDILKAYRPLGASDMLFENLTYGELIFDRYPKLKLPHSTAIKELSELHGQDVEIVED